MARKPPISLDGFDELIDKLAKAGKDVDSIADDCAKRSAEIADANLRKQMVSAGEAVAGMIPDLPVPSVEREGNSWYVKVGFDMPDRLDPKNPSEGHKAVFLNYGTPHRTERKGQVDARKFVTKARRKSVREIKKAEEQALAKMVEGLAK